MQVKDKFLEKINILIIVLCLFFSNNIYAENINEKIMAFFIIPTLPNNQDKYLSIHQIQ